MGSLVINNNFTHIGIIDSKGGTHHFNETGMHKTGIPNSIKIPLNQLDTFRDVVITPEIIREADLRWRGIAYQGGKLTYAGLNNCYGYVAHILTIAMKKKITQNDIDRDITRWLRANRRDLYDKLMKEQDPSYVPREDRRKPKKKTRGATRRDEDAEDPDLQRALQLSMETHRGATRRDEDAEDPDLQRALKLSMETHSRLGRGATRKDAKDEDSQLQEAMQLSKALELSKRSGTEPEPEPEPEIDPSTMNDEAIAHALAASLKHSKRKSKRRKSKRKSKRRKSKRKSKKCSKKSRRSKRRSKKR
jgi:hypothetical protein